jgi:hypothetical protein
LIILFDICETDFIVGEKNWNAWTTGLSHVQLKRETSSSQSSNFGTNRHRRVPLAPPGCLCRLCQPSPDQQLPPLSGPGEYSGDAQGSAKRQSFRNYEHSPKTGNDQHSKLLLLYKLQVEMFPVSFYNRKETGAYKRNIGRGEKSRTGGWCFRKIFAHGVIKYSRISSLSSLLKNLKFPKNLEKNISKCNGIYHVMYNCILNF